MKKTNKPAIVPTLMSSRGALWCALLVGYFLGILAIYNAYGKLVAKKAELAKPVVSEVTSPLFHVDMPLNWMEYAVTNNAVELRKFPGERVPMIEISAVRSPAYSFAALDMNPSIIARRLEDRISKSGIRDADGHIDVAVLGTEVVQVKPGVYAVHQLADCEGLYAELTLFYAGDCRYFLWGIFNDDDDAARRDVSEFFRHIVDSVDLPEFREAFERPIIDSNAITPELNRSAQTDIQRELALWRLFSDRAEHEPEAALLPAISHYREMLRALSSIRQEEGALNSEDFVRYGALLEIRAKTIREWFVQLDKLISIGDREGAKRQARFIIDHATLVDESLDVRRASEILTRLNAETQQ